MSAKEIIEMLKDQVWRFFRAIISSNHDYPYHDYVFINNSQGESALKGSYQVGNSNVDAGGDQKKRFVSKRAVIWTFTDDTTIRFNHSNNVEQVIPFHQLEPINEITVYRGEYHTNISEVFYTVGANGGLYMYFEGVLPEEARDAH